MSYPRPEIEVPSEIRKEWEFVPKTEIPSTNFRKIERKYNVEDVSFKSTRTGAKLQVVTLIKDPLEHEDRIGKIIRDLVQRGINVVAPKPECIETHCDTGEFIRRTAYIEILGLIKI